MTMRHRLGVLGGVLLLMVTPALAQLNTNPKADLGRVWTLADEETVASTGTFTSGNLHLTFGGFFAVWLLCESTAGAPDVKLEWQESPTTMSADFTTTTTIAANHTAETATIISFEPPPMMFGRLKITGNAGNAADTVCTVKTFVRGS